MGFFSPSKWGVKPSALVPRLPQCGKCGLHSSCQTPKMQPYGDGSVPILFVGEKPGEEEDREGQHLLGQSGQYLAATLDEMGLNIEDAIKTNAVICHPREKVKGFHVDSCRPNLRILIESHNPKVIVPLGSEAFSSVFGFDSTEAAGGIERWAGFQIPSQSLDAWICPTFHPAHVLRKQDSILEMYWERHLKAALPLVSKPVPVYDLEEIKKKIDIVLDPIAGRERMLALINHCPSNFLSFDYECTGLKPDHKDHEIICAAFSFNGVDNFATFITDENMAALSKVLRHGFRMIAANLKYEERWTVAKLGHPVKNWHWDTMIAAHCLDNRKKITGLKFQVYAHFGIADYEKGVKDFMASDEDGFNRLKEADPVDLLTYNGLDAYFTGLLAMIQWEKFRKRKRKFRSRR